MKEPPSNTLLFTFFSDQGLFYLSSFAGIILLLILSAVVSASEAAFFSFTSDHLDRFGTSDDKRYKLIASLLSRPRLLLVSFVFLDTLINVSIITLSTSLVWEVASSQPFHEWAVIFALVFSIIAIALGEIVPRIYGTNHNIRLAQLTAYTWGLWLDLLKPVSTFLIKMSALLEKRFKKSNQNATAGDLNDALELATENTVSFESDAGFLRRIVNFGTLTVSQVMQPRPEVSAVDIEISFHELMEFIGQTRFARIPVYRKSVDTIVGVLYTKDLLPFIDEEKTYRWQNLIRAGFFVLENKKISSLLRDFQEKHVHIAIAVNHLRVTVGLVTLEDIVQQIIGNIQEERKQKL